MFAQKLFAKTWKIGAAMLIAVAAGLTPAQAALPATVGFWTTANDPNPRSMAYCTQYGGAALNSQVPGAAITRTGSIVLFSSGDARVSATLWCMPVGNGMYVTLEVRTTDPSVNTYVLEQAIAQAFWTSGPVASSGAGRYVGCYTDSNTRDMPNQPSGSYSNSTCIAACAAMGFAYAATQYGSQCFCGNSYGSYGGSTNCNMACPAPASDQVCGGYFANSIYTAR